MSTMKPGRDLDALIAEKVMGWTKDFVHYPKVSGWKHPQDGIIVQTPDLPHYSTDISAAWEVVEKFSTLLKFQVSVEKNVDNQWRAIFFRKHLYFEYADTAPLAICLAALKAVGVEV